MSTAAEIDFPYPEGTPGADFKNNNGRYLRNLNDVNKAALVEIQAWVKTENVNLNDLCAYILSESLLLLRYLRANNFNTKKTKKHILKVIEWRRVQNIPELMKFTPEQILGCKMSDMIEKFPHWHFGYEKTGRPLLFKVQGEFDMKAIKALCGGNFERIFKYHIWEQELIGRVCYEQSLRSRTIIETSTVVLDVKGMTLSSLSSDFRTMMSALIKMDQEMYPETLGKMLIVNAPSVFPMIWGIMKPWFDPITAAKVTIQGTEYKKVLQEQIGAANLPANYSGTRPALTKDQHPYGEAMALFGPADPAASVTADLLVMKISADAPETVFTGLSTRGEGDSDNEDNAEVPDPEMPAECLTPGQVEELKASGAADVSPSPTPAATGGYKQREFIY